MAYVALGSNLASAAGDPAATLRAGLSALANALGCTGSRTRPSSLYETVPVGYRDQPWFINGAACLETTLHPMALLQVLQNVEQAFGRVRDKRDGPRTLDLDLLIYDEEVLSTPTLVLPHPRLAERRFVLQPLAEIAPGLVHPVLRRTMAELLAELPGVGEQAPDQVRRL